MVFMKRIYCRKCGNKILNFDDEYCPKCGTRINNYSEEKQMEKTKRTRNILLIVLVIICIIVTGTVTYTLFFNEQYQTIQISETASLEMPIGNGLNGSYVNGTSVYQINNGKGVMVMSYNSNNKDLSSPFAFAAVKEMAVGSRFNEDSLYQTTINGSTVWSIATGSNITHDNIIISSHDKDLTLRIYNSIKYNGNVSADSNNGTNHTNNNVGNKSVPYAYADDGSPIWTKEKFEKYVMEKGGYASLDEYYAVHRGDQQAINNFDARNHIYPESTSTSGGSSSGGGSSQGGGSSSGGSSSEGGGSAPT